MEIESVSKRIQLQKHKQKLYFTVHLFVFNFARKTFHSLSFFFVLYIRCCLKFSFYAQLPHSSLLCFTYVHVCYDALRSARLEHQLIVMICAKSEGKKTKPKRNTYTRTYIYIYEGRMLQWQKFKYAFYIHMYIFIDKHFNCMLLSVFIAF